MNRRTFLGKIAKAAGVIAAGGALISSVNKSDDFWDDFGQHFYRHEDRFSPVTDIANRDCNRLIGRIAYTVAYRSPYLDCLDRGTFPDVSDSKRCAN